MRIGERAARDLGWDELLSHLAGFCQSEPGRDDCLVLPLLDDRAAIEVELRAVKEAEDVLSRRERPPLGDVVDAAADLGRARKGGALPPQALLGIARLAAASNLVRGFVMRRRDHYPAIAGRYGGVERVEGLGEEIRRVLDDQGQVRDNASPILGELREQMSRLRGAIIGRIKELWSQPLVAEMLQDQYYTIRNGRYVLPVKVNFKNALKGIIHGASQTGATLFIEPEQLIEPGNEIMICESRMDDEISRLLHELTRRTAQAAEVLSANLSTLRALDVLFAKAELASRIHASTPVIGDRVRLLAARHPLLTLRDVEVVPNDITLPPGCRGLLISGPNAGGKTVLLKTVGLCAAMTSAGIPCPVMPGSEIPLFDEAFSVFGDAQDLAGDLSSFSGHLMMLNRIIGTAGPRSLVLLDEIASDTDPREGAALAAAIIEELSARGSAIFATSHFSELREWVSARSADEGDGPVRIVNASVGFDLLRLRPSFKLDIGVAGESFALRIAGNLGLPARIIDRARSFLGAAYVEGERLLQKLKRREEELDTAVTAARAREEELAREFTTRKKQLEEEQEAARKAYEAERERLIGELKTLREKAAGEIARIQKSSDMKGAVDVQKWMSDVMRDIDRKKPSARPSRPPAPGDRVEMGTLGGIVGTVERIDYAKREASVTSGGKRLTVPIASLTLSESAPPQPAARPISGAEMAKSIARGKGQEAAQTELDLRGLYAEEAVTELEVFLDKSFREDLDTVRIIHGLGTGALRNAVRDHLKGSPYVRSFRPGEQREGGDGVSMVSMKKE